MPKRVQEQKCKDEVNCDMNEFVVRKKFKGGNLLARYARLCKNGNRTKHGGKLIEAE
jgi:hypothetical protein